jgi:biofilm PGA synthesis lipoprotein PgaB
MKTLFPLFSLWRTALLGLLLAVALPAPAQPLPPADPSDGLTFRVLSFHDVRTNVRATFEDSPDETAVDERTFAEVFAWLVSCPADT